MTVRRKHRVRPGRAQGAKAGPSPRKVEEGLLSLVAARRPGERYRRQALRGRPAASASPSRRALRDSSPKMLCFRRSCSGRASTHQVGRRRAGAKWLRASTQARHLTTLIWTHDFRKEAMGGSRPTVVVMTRAARRRPARPTERLRWPSDAGVRRVRSWAVPKLLGRGPRQWAGRVTGGGRCPFEGPGRGRAGRTRSPTARPSTPTCAPTTFSCSRRQTGTPPRESRRRGVEPA